MGWRRHDWPPPLGYVIEDGVMLDRDRYASIWSVAPFGKFDPKRGDGGEVYRIENGTVRIALTQDGGTPWVQHFVGIRCVGTGWIAFRDDASTGTWAETVAELSIAQSDADCPLKLNKAFTRYRRERVTMPFVLADGSEKRIPVDAVIAEHYNAASLGNSVVLERSFFAAGWGRLRWEGWQKNGAAPVDLSPRCPTDKAPAYSDPPDAGWSMTDCRTWTVIVSGPPARVADFGWPPLAAPP